MNKTILTHSGYFQADDIFAVAILLLALGECQVVRSRDKGDINSADFVVDVGMIYDPARNRFDHHQPGGAGERVDGIPYSSCGLVWKEFGEKLCGGRAEADLIDTVLIEPLDAHDNGVTISDPRLKNIRMYSIVDFLYSYLPSFHESEESLYKIFMNCVGIAKDLLNREIAKAKLQIEGETLVQDIFQKSPDKKVIVLPQELPWGRVFKEKQDVLYVIYPRNDGRWGVRAVQDTGFLSRKPFPADWGGKMDNELQEITGVRDAIFCHRGLFTAVTKSKEGAIKLAELALNA